jgi:predicted transcriptional regulator
MSSDSGRSGDADAFRLRGTVRLFADGVAKVLGDLEALVMRTVWTFDQPTPAREIHERVRAEHDVTIHTVITVLNKLVKKGLLLRRKKGDLLHFEAALTEEAFRVEVSRQVVEGILTLGPDAVTASLVDVLAEHDPSRLQNLAELIQKRLAEQPDP